MINNHHAWQITFDQAREIQSELAKKITSHYGLDPLKTIASGAMLIFCDQNAVEMITKSLNQNNITCFEIGEAAFSGADKGVSR